MRVIYDPPGRETREEIQVPAVMEQEHGIYLGNGSGNSLGTVIGYIPYDRLHFVLPDES